MSNVAKLTPTLLPTKYTDLLPFLDAFQRDVLGAIEKTANTGVTNAALAQNAADLSLAEVAALSLQNQYDLREAAFLRHWRVM